MKQDICFLDFSEENKVAQSKIDLLINKYLVYEGYSGIDTTLGSKHDLGPGAHGSLFSHEESSNPEEGTVGFNQQVLTRIMTFFKQRGGTAKLTANAIDSKRYAGYGNFWLLAEAPVSPKKNFYRIDFYAKGVRTPIVLERAYAMLKGNGVDIPAPSESAASKMTAMKKDLLKKKDDWEKDAVKREGKFRFELAQIPDMEVHINYLDINLMRVEHLPGKPVSGTENHKGEATADQQKIIRASSQYKALEKQLADLKSGIQKYNSEYTKAYYAYWKEYEQKIISWLETNTKPAKKR